MCKWGLFSGLIFLFTLASCGSPGGPSPRPRAYPKVNYPEKKLREFGEDVCDFSFSFPDYARVVRDTAFFEEKPVHPCWFDLYMPDFDGRIHFSYYPVGNGKSLDQLKKDAFELVDWHNKRANYIEELPFSNPEENVQGIAFQIEGPAASPFQFYITDDEEHFVRGALYFNTQVRPDSLAPIIDFVTEDIATLLESFRWKG
jgi:gliding motility-associated lipoprotein GldD